MPGVCSSCRMACNEVQSKTDPPPQATVAMAGRFVGSHVGLGERCRRMVGASKATAARYSSYLPSIEPGSSEVTSERPLAHCKAQSSLGASKKKGGASLHVMVTNRHGSSFAGRGPGWLLHTSLASLGAPLSLFMTVSMHQEGKRSSIVIELHRAMQKLVAGRALS
ncbi:hypothetical protein AB1Y20_020584 [Prymnesium parvum]|uniref:Uncharacterized protein n=1 Tax=Prymnesium parvum TaxID=97485 RepID=A0AB34JVN7_PRYPA